MPASYRASSGSKFLSAYDESRPKSMEEWEILTPIVCPTCGGKLKLLQSYDHESGWSVQGKEKKQWLYRFCPRCNYDWAIWKLGIKREAQ